MTDPNLPGPLVSFEITQDGQIIPKPYIQRRNDGSVWQHIPGQPPIRLLSAEEAYEELQIVPNPYHTGWTERPKEKLVSAEVVQRITIQIQGPGTEPRTGLMGLSAPPIPRVTGFFTQELPNLWPDDVRDHVLSFLSELAAQDSEASQRAMDETKHDPLDEVVVRQQALQYATEAGWFPPSDIPEIPEWAISTDRTPEQKDPIQHAFVSLPVPGQTHRCAWCGNVAHKHTESDQPEDGKLQSE